jgi:predicted transport protein
LVSSPIVYQTIPGAVTFNFHGVWDKFNIPFETIHDAKGICRDTTNTGNFSNNDVLFKLTIDTDINYVMELAMQAPVYQLED